MINQGGPSNGTSNSTYTFNGNTFLYSGDASSDYIGLSWLAAHPGQNAVAKYNIYRNGSLYDSISSPVTITGYISGTTLTVTGVSGGKSAKGIADGKILPGLMLNSSAAGFHANTVIVLYTDAGVGGGGVGHYSVNWSQSVGNAASPATFTAWEYNDTAAANANRNRFDLQDTVYTYAVTATDAANNESASAYPVSYQFSGVSFSNGSDFDYGNASTVYNDTTGAPANGPYDMKWTWPGSGGVLLVFGNGSASTSAPTERFELGAFKYLTLDVKVTDTSYQTSALNLVPVSRAYGTLSGNGDTNHWNSVNLWKHCTPVVNAWVTCKVPLSETNYGTTNFTGTFVGTGLYTGTLTVQSIQSQTANALDGSSYIVGAGIPANSYITGYSQLGGVGTYTLAGPGITGSENVSAESMVAIGSAAYKFGFQWNGSVSTSMYVNNVGFTTN